MSGNYSKLYRLIEKRTANAGVIGLGHRARTRARERFSIAGPGIGQGDCAGRGEGASGGLV